MYFTRTFLDGRTKGDRATGFSRTPGSAYQRLGSPATFFQEFGPIRDFFFADGDENHSREVVGRGFQLVPGEKRTGWKIRPTPRYFFFTPMFFVMRMLRASSSASFGQVANGSADGSVTRQAAAALKRLERGR
jgi:hypothetical protein